jgi:hypothetical protein
LPISQFRKRRALSSVLVAHRCAFPRRLACAAGLQPRASALRYRGVQFLRARRRAAPAAPRPLLTPAPPPAMMGTLRVGALLCKPLGVLIGFIYPAFASWKALESRKGEAATGQSAARSQGKDGWLTYWVVFSCFTVLEHVADFLISWRALAECAMREWHACVAMLRALPRRMPLYYVAKLAFVIWLQAPQTKARECARRRKAPNLRSMRMRMCVCTALNAHALRRARRCCMCSTSRRC